MAAAPEVTDVRLIDPTEKELVASLKKAHAAANRGVTYGRTEKMARDADFWGRFARDCLREPAGRRRSCKAGYQTPEVIAGWWTDPAGRRHFRILGRTRERYARLRREGELRGLPAWWQVYPESVLALRRPGDDEAQSYLACCRCGKVGSPESLGWMGDTCGPCFDRRADGGTPAGGFGHFTGWLGWQACVGFSSDGSRLVGPGLSNPQRVAHPLRAVNRFDGGEATTKALPAVVVAAVGTPEGFVFAYAHGAAYRWDGASTPQRLVGPPPNTYGRPLLSPDGRRMVVMSQNVGFTADLTYAKPAYIRVAGLRLYSALRFAPDGRRLYGVTPTGELFALAPDTLHETLVRANAYDGIQRFGYPHDLAVSFDGSTLALIREHYMSSITVRLIPLAEHHPPHDLPLPKWHRPNAAAFAPDGKHLVTADPQAGWVGFWRLPSGRPLGFVRAVPEDPSWRGGQVMFSPDGRSIAVLYTGIHQERGSTVAVWPWPDVATAAAG